MRRMMSSDGMSDSKSFMVPLVPDSDYEGLRVMLYSLPFLLEHVFQEKAENSKCQ
jgi:hypothetical protein